MKLPARLLPLVLERKARTVLTCATLVLLTFIVLSFTSEVSTTFSQFPGVLAVLRISLVLLAVTFCVHWVSTEQRLSRQSETAMERERAAAFVNFCHALLNSNEFLFRN